MRTTYFDRPRRGRRLGIRAAGAAWAVVFALFALVLVAPTLFGNHKQSSQDRVIAPLLARVVVPQVDACLSTDRDYGETDKTPSLC